jgi:hypothetical protein
MVDEYMEGQTLGHVGRVKLGEAEGRLAELAVFLLGMRQPFHQAILMDVLYAATAFARIKERLVRSTFAPTDSTCIGIYRAIVSPGVARGHVIAFGVCSYDGLLL